MKSFSSNSVYPVHIFDHKKIDRKIHKIIMGKNLSDGRIPSYSKDVGLAIKVQKHMANWGFCCFELLSDYDFCYRARFIHRRDHSIEYSINVEDSPALAICLAALLGYKVNLDRLRLTKNSVSNVKIQK